LLATITTWALTCPETSIQPYTVTSTYKKYTRLWYVEKNDFILSKSTCKDAQL